VNKMINLEKFIEGAFSERVNQGIREVSENISDPNTDWKKKRKLTVEMVFETNEARELTNVEIECKSKLAPNKPIKTSIIIDKTLDGVVLASEFKKQIPGQTFMKVDDETGEITSNGLTKDVGAEDLKGLQIVK
jgi:hypothetical protein